MSQVQTTKATSNEIAIRTDDRVGGRRTITASSSAAAHPTEWCVRRTGSLRQFVVVLVTARSAWLGWPGD